MGQCVPVVDSSGQKQAVFIGKGTEEFWVKLLSEYLNGEIIQKEDFKIHYFSVSKHFGVWNIDLGDFEDYF